MNSYDIISAGFHRRIELITGAVDALAPGLQRAADALADAALADRRIFVAASGPDAALASYAACLLRNPGSGLPPLPAIAVTSDGQGSDLDPLWRELRTVARDGDILLFLDSAAGAAGAREAALRAGERNLLALLLSDAEDAEAPIIAATLRGESDEERRELALMAMHSLQHLVLQILMGES